jgi:hypothetical protein
MIKERGKRKGKTKKIHSGLENKKGDGWQVRF